MNINLSPLWNAATLVVRKAGDALTINGETFDFSPLPDGAVLPAGSISSEWITGDVRRVNGKLELTLVLPHGAHASHECLFPSPLIDPPDGLLALPFTPEPEAVEVPHD